MDVLRTPDERFEGLPGYAFAPHYVEIPAGDADQPDQTLRLHHLDEGPADGEVVLLLHGEPSWSYLYRHMIPVLVDAGLRCIAPDLVGFGRSDKPTPRTEYTYERHVEWLRAALFDQLDLRDITLVCQDWGGLLGLRLVGEHPDRFARVVAANTFLPTGDRDLGDAFRAWCDFSQNAETLPVGNIVNGGSTTDLSPEVIAAYDAPFPDESYKEGARQFPILVPAPTIRPCRPTWRPGRRSSGSTGPSCAPSPTRTPSPPAPTATSSGASPVRRAWPTRPSRAVGTSSRRIGDPSWPGSWSTWCGPRRRPDDAGLAGARRPARRSDHRHVVALGAGAAGRPRRGSGPGPVAQSRRRRRRTASILRAVSTSAVWSFRGLALPLTTSTSSSP